jgi:type II secretory pathway component PulC
MKTTFTPEEKLLRLIRKKKNKDKPFSHIRLKVKGFLTAVYWRIKTFFKKRKTQFHLRPLKYINQFLSIMVILLVFYGVKIIYSLPGQTLLSHAGPERTLMNKVNENILENKKGRSLSFYMRRIRGKRIFKIYQSQKPKIKEKIKEEKKPTLKELTKNLILSGIVFDEGRPEAIIKDGSKKQTFFLHQGDSIDDFKIEEILNNAVIVSYKGEKIRINMP